MRHHVRRGLLGVSALVLSGSLLVGCADDAQDDAQDDSPAGTQDIGTAEADAAATWLAAQLEDGTVTASYEETPGSGEWTTYADHGLALDVLFALRDRDDHAEARTAVLDALEPQAGIYVGTGPAAYAGSTGKLLAALVSEDRDPGAFAGAALVERLEGLVHTGEGDELGWARDTWDPADETGADYSTAIGQAWVVRGLAAAGSDLADEATAFLLRQQCEEGFFRVTLASTDHSCDGGTAEESVPSADATGLAVLALLEARDAGVEDGGTPAAQGLDAALESARAWLLETQAEDGSFTDADTGQANANSTGVAGEALLAFGEEEAAADAAAWLAARQVGEDADVADDADDKAAELAEEVGAVAFDDAAWDAATTDGITQGTRGQWQRATAQSVVALGALGAGD